MYRTSCHKGGFDCHRVCYLGMEKEQAFYFTLLVERLSSAWGEGEGGREEMETVTVSRTTLANQRHAGEISEFCISESIIPTVLKLGGKLLGKSRGLISET